MSDEPAVLVSAARLRELEAAAAALPVVAAKLAKRTHNNLESLRAYDAAHPEKAAERRHKYKETHREEVNAKRREKRRLAREARLAGAAADEIPGGDGAAIPPALKSPPRIGTRNVNPLQFV